MPDSPLHVGDDLSVPHAGAAQLGQHGGDISRGDEHVERLRDARRLPPRLQLLGGQDGAVSDVSLMVA